MQTGWKNGKYDSRDFEPKPAAAVFPPFYSLSVLLPNVRNQGFNNSCVGFGIGVNLCAIAKSLGIYSEWFLDSLIGVIK
jgi:hypothetical protein